jgi:hydrogenase maturation protease
MLIIGCGNRQRGDDAAGIMVAEQLQARGIAAEVSLGSTADLIEAWSGANDVILVDAVTTHASVGTVHLWDARHPLPSGQSSGSTHGLGVAEAIELARAMNCLPPRLRIYGIEGHRFEIGSEASAEVKRAVAEVVQRIAGEVKAAG